MRKISNLILKFISVKILLFIFYRVPRKILKAVYLYIKYLYYAFYREHNMEIEYDLKKYLVFYNSTNEENELV